MIVEQVFLEAMEGCHLLLGPLFVMQTAIFRICPSAVVQIFAAVCFKESRPLVPSAIVGRLSCFVSSASLDCFRPVLAARSLRALNRSSFSWLLSVARLFAASSGIARKRRSLSCPVSPAHFNYNFQPLFPFLPGLLGQFGKKPLAVCLQPFLSFGSTCRSNILARFLPCWQIYPHNPSELGASRPATPYQAPTPSGRYTHITRQSSALHAPLLLYQTSTPSGRYTHITRQSSALHAPLLLTSPHSKWQIYPHNPSELGAPRPATPYQALTPSGRYAHITRQSSALHAPLLLTRPPLQVADIPT